MSGGGASTPPLPAPQPIPVEIDAKKAQDDVRRRLAQARGRSASTAAGFLETPPIVSNLALSDTLG